MVKGSSALAAQSAERRLIPMQRGQKLNIAAPPQHGPGLKVHKEPNQPKVNHYQIKLGLRLYLETTALLYLHSMPVGADGT